MSNDVQYFAPKSLEEALEILGEHGSNVSVLAGGTDLVRDMNLEFKIPKAILWIGHLGLEYIKEETDVLHIGAATRMQVAGASKVLQQKASAVAQRRRRWPVRRFAAWRRWGAICVPHRLLETRPAVWSAWEPKSCSCR